MTKQVGIIGAGMGGLAAAIHLAKNGFQVKVFEARDQPGGLASSFEVNGNGFDAGPYILLDVPGLSWAFEKLGISLDENISLLSIDPIYEVYFQNESSLKFFKDCEQTAAELEQRWPASGKKYFRFVQKMRQRYSKLKPLLCGPPNFSSLIRNNAWTQIPFLLRPLKSALSESELPQEIQRALSIWTFIAGQNPEEAPSPMAFVPAIFHFEGAFYPRDGIGQIPKLLENAAKQLGVDFYYGLRVKAIRCNNYSACGIETEANDFYPFNIVISNSHGVGTYLNLIQELPSSAIKHFSNLQLQSPGICIYLKVKSNGNFPYLRFFVEDTNECVLFVRPHALLKSQNECARLIAPMNHKKAESAGREGQERLKQDILNYPRWQKDVSEFEVLHSRVPSVWGNDFNLYRDSMNPVMTARMMRAGRLSHRSPWIQNLYLAGSSTHPGQWISFCAISGILAADCVIQDHKK